MGYSSDSEVSEPTEEGAWRRMMVFAALEEVCKVTGLQVPVCQNVCHGPSWAGVVSVGWFVHSFTIVDAGFAFVVYSLSQRASSVSVGALQRREIRRTGTYELLEESNRPLRRGRTIRLPTDDGRGPTSAKPP